jgi:hypothetical protein
MKTRFCLLRQSERSMIVTMRAVRMMHMPGDEIICVIPVRHPGMPAIGVMGVIPFVGSARVLRRALLRVGCIHRDTMFVSVAAVCMVQMAIVEVIDVSIVQHSYVATLRSVLMLMPVLPMSVTTHEPE